MIIKKKKRQCTKDPFIRPLLNPAADQLISKPSEKPRLTQIPSEDMDLEETGSGSSSGPGSLCGSEPGSLGEERHLQRRQSAASTDSVYDTESNASSRESLAEHPTALAQVLMSAQAHTWKRYCYVCVLLKCN